MKKLLAILLALLMLLSVVGCSSSGKDKDTNNDSAADTADTADSNDGAGDSQPAASSDGELKANGDYRIAFIQKDKIDEYFIDCDTGSAARAKELGITVDFYTPDGGQTDVEGEVNLMNDCIVKQYDIIMIDPTDNLAFIPSIVAANEADIPVVLFNDGVDENELEASGGYYASYIGINSYEASKEVGKYCAQTSEPGKVLLLEGLSGLVASEERVNGFRDGLTDEFEIAASQPADWDMNTAYDVTTNMLTANPDISIIFAASSTMGLGAIQALKDMGIKDQVDVYDFDCTQADLQAIIDGDLLATLRYPTIEWATLGVDTCVRILNGEQVDKQVWTAVEVVTAAEAPSLLK